MKNGEIFKKAEKISAILDLLSSPMRLMITCMLINGEKNVTEIIERVGTTKGNISQHLRLLSDGEILESRRDGNRIFYRIRDRKTAVLVRNLKKLYCPDFRV